MMSTVTRTGNVITVTLLAYDDKRKTMVCDLDSRTLRVDDKEPREMTDAEVRHVVDLYNRRRVTGNPNIAYPEESVHVADIRVGDTVLIGDEYRTVCAKDITRNECGICLFGSSYNSGRLPVQRALTTQGRRIESPDVE